MTHPRPAPFLLLPLLLAACAAAFPAPAHAEESLCDVAYEDCRTPLLDLIAAEQVGIDAAWWFMEDQRFADALLERWRAGVPVRVIVDLRANASYPLNAQMLQLVRDAGIPMRRKTSSGIMHWKMMLFAGQNTVEFSGANYSPDAFVYHTPYSNYVDEVIYFSDDPAVVNSFKTKFDDLWTSTSGYADYANVTARTRSYPAFPIDPEMNFPPGSSSVDFALRSVRLYDRETVGIDALMYRITDRRHTDALIAALGRGVPVRLITEQLEYRNPDRPWVSWNVDRLYMAGAQVRLRGHQGLNHEKLTVLRGQALAVFGSSNWTGPSANSQQEHNIFTAKPWFVAWATDHFERKWFNRGPSPESQPFTPLPPDRPEFRLPLDGASNQPSSVTLSWYAGRWAHNYDIYFGTTANPPLYAADVNLGFSATSSDYKTFEVTDLAPGVTYYWRVVSKTMANLTRSTIGVRSFRTAGGSLPGGGSGDVVLYAYRAALRQGWNVVADTSAANGARLSNTNRGFKASGPSANPDEFFDLSFQADAGVPYRIWIRGRAAGNSYANDSVYVQFSDSVDAAGSPQWRIGTASGSSVIIENCSGCNVSGWGWNDNGYGAGMLGPLVYFDSPGEHTLRVQVREDGLSIDQIVLSRSAFLDEAPGAPKNDGTILAESGGSGGPTPPPSEGDIVIHAASATVHGAWTLVDDPSAAGGVAMVLPNANRGKVVTAVASPDDYVELTFTAQADTPYRLWMRGRALSNFYGNDSVHVQFNDSVGADGDLIWSIGSTSSAEVNLEACSGCGLSGWGWQDNGWGAPDALGPLVTFATSGVKSMRIQNREDGFSIDQVVLSPSTYLTSAPGPDKDATTILPETP